MPAIYNNPAFVAGLLFFRHHSRRGIFIKPQILYEAILFYERKVYHFLLFFLSHFHPRRNEYCKQDYC